mmetsp:Transcript_2931/g.7073  ORF Transcript_2931/g.7073 Transcript_2931/m.7073 type:complete len:150 (+) Transcript_2931:113-562(+)|eukprot:CAMPEP_0206605208 /NCGR_PEP_ID=MMETSP0325_2-20121206/50251_1 /ASSEMBLY_ACC=CAM_ASM_000347 /TAXON_ID=2866 /ORGANISM="Crypthecodinium cohnii, Strain Seligo" /LENGTH=149 /DNA_ID=CAMNT_0054120653 /DNA_START=28 /DNA_END=477 /DNA_ORIENTATION=+
MKERDDQPYRLLVAIALVARNGKKNVLPPTLEEEKEEEKEEEEGMAPTTGCKLTEWRQSDGHEAGHCLPQGRNCTPGWSNSTPFIHSVLRSSMKTEQRDCEKKPSSRCDKEVVQPPKQTNIYYIKETRQQQRSKDHIKLACLLGLAVNN